MNAMEECVSSELTGKQPTLTDWLAKDNRKAPPAYSRRTEFDMGVEDLPVARYISREFHELEMKRMWPRAWQMACHESNIPDAGDYTTYELGDRSWFLTRQKDGSIKAFVNACLHRGMQLVEGSGKLPAIVCPFHGWSWNTDGTNRGVTERWDLPQLKDRDLCLPQAKVATWGGFVFINPDPNRSSIAALLRMWRGSLRRTGRWRWRLSSKATTSRPRTRRQFRSRNMQRLSTTSTMRTSVA
jgi:phenylpropionate dioxygenase-like ring-hydroxylating dioxygenase large terminal subunit